MKKLLVATVGLLVCGSAFAGLPDIGATNVQFKSVVNASSCKVALDEQDVALDSTLIYTLKTGQAATISDKEFNVELKECPTDGYRNSTGTPHDIKVYVTDKNNSTNENNQGLLKNTEGADYAKGVSVQLLKGNSPLKVASTTDNTDNAIAYTITDTTNITDGKIVLPLKARLYANSSENPDITAGKVHATAELFFQYK